MCVFDEVGIICSVGVVVMKYVVKMVLMVVKFDGMFVVFVFVIFDFFVFCLVWVMWGVGLKVVEVLEVWGICIIWDVCELLWEMFDCVVGLVLSV